MKYLHLSENVLKQFVKINSFFYLPLDVKRLLFNELSLLFNSPVNNLIIVVERKLPLTIKPLAKKLNQKNGIDSLRCLGL